jgi:hypothetical protein
MNDKWWWGWLDDKGVIRFFPYIDKAQIEKTEKNPHCKGIFDPFTAENKKEAQRKIAEWLTQKEEKRIIN